MKFNPVYSWELAQHIMTFCYWLRVQIFKQYVHLFFKLQFLNESNKCSKFENYQNLNSFQFITKSWKFMLGDQFKSLELIIRTLRCLTSTLIWWKFNVLKEMYGNFKKVANWKVDKTGQQTKFSVQLWTTFTLLHTCESSYNFR